MDSRLTTATNGPIQEIRSLWSWSEPDSASLRTPDTMHYDFLGYGRFVTTARSRMPSALLRCRSLQDEVRKRPETARVEEEKSWLGKRGTADLSSDHLAGRSGELLRTEN